MAGIESWLPAFDVGERHETTVGLPPEQALQRALTTPAAPDGLIRLRFRLRGLRPEGSIERFYWLVVGPFSALIRRRWLRAAARPTSSV
jgi:hypothetical protein